MITQAAEYNAGAKSFHWLTVALLGSQFIIGWIMPGVRHNTPPEGLISLHFSLGLVILAVTAARLLWRLAFGVPTPETSLPRWQHQAAEALHTALYVLLVALVFSGWAYASSHGVAGLFSALRQSPPSLPTGREPGRRSVSCIRRLDGCCSLRSASISPLRCIITSGGATGC